MAGRKKLQNGLTAVQEKFCMERAKGKTQQQAYAASHPNSTASLKSQYEIGARMESNELLRKRIADLQKQVEAGLILDLAQIQTMISGMAADPDRPDVIRLKAADQLTRMRGGYKDSIDVSARVSIDDRRAALADLLPGGAGPE